ncbi:class I SAM-dependent methyltransferase [Gemella sp. zg-570]|uniref:class I SAM-dependent DNA methyltransferase n=1 Tax=Gemella sp. zg-570 TaxID=2840371 RepID=UPI001C0B7C15|nr:class I SAM-dependent methyltransferase [Gemella sp. zg-570]QWQ39212.1 class I SAM-dependent methyltransferase [Gemella sp. zg-570]
MYQNLSIVYDRIMDVDYDKYKNIIKQELMDSNNLLILDLGCGSGALTEYLATYGQVFAVDKSEEMLALASNKFSKANYIALDLLEIQALNKKFDFIISAFDVFNYLENFEEFTLALENVYAVLKKGGKFIFDIHTPSKIDELLNEQPFAYEDEEISYLWFTYPTENKLEVESEITFFVKEKDNLYKKIYEYQKQRTYNIDKIIEKILEIGFKIKTYFCDFEFANKDYQNSKRLIFVLEK